MTNYFLLPVWNATQFFDNNGNVLAGGTISTYEGGSFSIEQTTFATQTGTANPNPITLDANGRIPVEMWGPSGQVFNLVLRDSQDNQLQVAENVVGVQPSVEAGSEATINLWNSTTSPTFIGPTSFLLGGNQALEFEVGNRVQFINGVSTYGYGTVTAVLYSSPNTQVTIQCDSTVVGSNLSAVFWSALVVSGKTVDAGATSFASGLTYSNLATVGGQISNLYTTLATDVATLNVSILNRNVVYNTGGSFSGGGTAFTLTPSPAATGLTVNASYDIKFGANGGSVPTLNISGLGAHALVQLNSSGAYAAAVIVSGHTTRVLYSQSAGVYVMLSQAPAAVASGGPFFLSAPVVLAEYPANFIFTGSVGMTNINQGWTNVDTVAALGVSGVKAVILDAQWFGSYTGDGAPATITATGFILVRNDNSKGLGVPPLAFPSTDTYWLVRNQQTDFKYYNQPSGANQGTFPTRAAAQGGLPTYSFDYMIPASYLGSGSLRAAAVRIIGYYL